MAATGAWSPWRLVCTRRITRAGVFRPVHTSSNAKFNLVFLGTPNVAAVVLDSLLEAASAENSIFQVAGVVTQPPAVRGRVRKPLPSPVAQKALARNFPSDLIFSPEKAGEQSFLEQLKSLKPDLCVTAAYGNILPQRLLDIPKNGTVNIHPSLLPLYRGAAPVQRAVQEGVRVTGVTVAYTVRALDSGPVVTSETVEVDENIKAPELQDQLFGKGIQLLLRELPGLLDGTAKARAIEQDHSKATLAPKINVEEAWLDFSEPAVVLHNKVRAFAEWPGTKSKLKVSNSDGSESELLELKIVTTRVTNQRAEEAGDEILIKGGSLLVQCGDDSWLEILEVQPPGRKAMRVRDFCNGLQGKQISKCHFSERELFNVTQSMR